jgi:SOS-response transcriptional repressor LexA
MRPTARQSECLQFIETMLRERGIAPSFGEIIAALGLKSKAHVARLLSALEEKGYIRRMSGRARAIEVLRRVPQTQAERYERDLVLVRAFNAARRGVPGALRYAGIVPIRSEASVLSRGAP